MNEIWRFLQKLANSGITTSKHLEIRCFSFICFAPLFLVKPSTFHKNDFQRPRKLELISHFPTTDYFLISQSLHFVLFVFFCFKCWQGHRNMEAMNRICTSLLELRFSSECKILILYFEVSENELPWKVSLKLFSELSMYDSYHIFTITFLLRSHGIH